MKPTHQHKEKLRKLASKIARDMSSLAPVRKFARHRRAVNAVISNVILIGAVIIVGFTILFWSQYQSSTYQAQYTDDINSEIGQLQEKVVFEYVVPIGSSNIRVYLLNCGKQNVTINEVFVSTGLTTISSSSIQLKRFNNSPTEENTLHTGEQAYFQISTLGLSSQGPYLVKIVTGRDSTFVGSS